MVIRCVTRSAAYCLHSASSWPGVPPQRPTLVSSFTGLLKQTPHSPWENVGPKLFGPQVHSGPPVQCLSPLSWGFPSRLARAGSQFSASAGASLCCIFTPDTGSQASVPEHPPGYDPASPHSYFSPPPAPWQLPAPLCREIGTRCLLSAGAHLVLRAGLVSGSPARGQPRCYKVPNSHCNQWELGT